MKDLIMPNIYPKSKKDSINSNKEQGTAREQYELGLLYEHGKSVAEQDYGKALHLFKLSSQQGNQEATTAFHRLSEELSKRKKIIIIGDAGVGKKTLINAYLSNISSSNVKLGTGIKISQESITYFPVNIDCSFSIITTHLNEEAHKDIGRIKDYFTYLNSFYSKENIIVWYCIPSGEPKPLQTDGIALIDAVYNSNVPVIIVITKGNYFLNGHVRPWTADSQLFFLVWNSVVEQIVGVIITRAKKKKITNKDAIVNREQGIDELKLATQKVFHLMKK